MVTPISFFVPGEPVAKARVQRSKPFIAKNGKAVSYNYTPNKTVAFEERVKYYALLHKPDTPYDGAVSLTLQFMFLKPKSAKKRRYPHVRPDIDNLEKAVMDAMNGLIYRDDALVCTKSGMKAYTQDTSKVGVYVQVAEMKEGEK